MEIGVRRVGTVWCDVERLGLACVELWWRRGFAAAVLGGGGVAQPARISMQAAAPAATRCFVSFVIIAFIPCMHRNPPACMVYRANQ